MRALGFLRWLLRLSHTYTDPLELRQARGLLWMALMTLVAMVAGTLLISKPSQPDVIFFAGEPFLVTDTAYLALYGFGALGMGLVAYLISRGALSAARALYVIVYFLFAFTLYLYNGPFSFTLFALTLPVTAIGVLFNRRGLALGMAVTGLTLVVLIVFSAIGLLGFQQGRTFGLDEVLLLGLLVLLVAGTTLGVFVGEQRALARRNIALAAELNSMTTTTRTVAVASSIDDLLARTIELVRGQLGYYHVQAFLVQERTGMIALATGIASDRPGVDMARRRIALDADTAVNAVVQSGASLHVTLASPPNLRSEFLPATRAALLVPLLRGDQVIGVLDVQSVQPDAFDEMDRKVLESLALQVAGGIENLRLAEAFQEANRERQTLQEQVRTARLEVERLNQEVRGRSWVYYLENRPDKLIGFDWANGTITPSTTAPEPLEPGAGPRIEMRDGVHVLIVPIRSRGHALGVMEFCAPRDRVWDNRSLELARTIAQRLALSLDNLRLFEQAQMTVAREQIANQIATMLQTRSDVDSLIAVAAESFQQALGATRASVRLGTPERPSVGPGRSHHNGGDAS
jgi:GAF domain-containing protein